MAEGSHIEFVILCALGISILAGQHRRWVKIVVALNLVHPIYRLARLILAALA